MKACKLKFGAVRLHNGTDSSHTRDESLPIVNIANLTFNYVEKVAKNVMNMNSIKGRNKKEKLR